MIGRYLGRSRGQSPSARHDPLHDVGVIDATSAERAAMFVGVSIREQSLDRPNVQYCRQYNYMIEPIVEEVVSAADAHRRFSLLLRGGA